MYAYNPLSDFFASIRRTQIVMWRVSAHLRIYSTNGFSASVHSLGSDVKIFCACTHIFHRRILCVCTQNRISDVVQLLERVKIAEHSASSYLQVGP